MKYSETAGEQQPAVENFPGTDISRLTLSTDEPWLSLLVLPGNVVDEALLERLNTDAEIALGGPLAESKLKDSMRNQVIYPRAYGGMESLPPSLSKEKRLARNRFYNTGLGAQYLDSPLFKIRRYLKAPSSFIDQARLFYEYTVEAFPTVLEFSDNLLDYSSVTLRSRFELAEVEGFSVKDILLRHPRVFGYSEIGEHRQAFIKRLQAVGTDKGKNSKLPLRLSKLAPVERPGQLMGTELTPEQTRRFLSLAALTNLEIDMLQHGLPQISELDDTEAQRFEGEVIELCSADNDIRIRDLVRLLGRITSNIAE